MTTDLIAEGERGLPNTFGTMHRTTCNYADVRGDVHWVGGDAMNEQEFNQRALAMLRNLGVQNPQVGVDGSFDVHPGEFAFVNRPAVDETTILPVRTLNTIPSPVETVQAARPANVLCSILPCALLLGDCCREETRWFDPTILLDAAPVRIPEATAFLNPLNARIEGDIRLQASNQSEPGARRTDVVCKCAADRTGDRQTVRGSATLDGDDQHTVVVDRLDETLDDVAASFQSLAPDAEANREAGFRKEGPLNLIESLLDILITGTIQTTADVQTTVRYEWRGRAQTKTFSASPTVRLPVDNVRWSW